MEIQKIKAPNGTEIEMITARFTINPDQQIAVIDGIDQEYIANVSPDREGINVEHLGKLSEQSYIFKCQLINSLRIDKWDFVKYPDPEIFMITKET